MKVELVTSLKRQATKILADFHETKQPVLITEHGKPSAYLVDVAGYELMQNRLAIFEGIARGLQEAIELSQGQKVAARAHRPESNTLSKKRGAYQNDSLLPIRDSRILDA